MVSEDEVLNALFNHNSFDLFNTFALEGGDRDNIMERLQLTRKQYYSRIGFLIKSGLVQKQNEKYFLTSFGEVVHKAVQEARQLIGLAVKEYWKLKAIDAIQLSLPKKELNKTIEALIDKPEIKEIILKKGQIQQEKNSHNALSR